MLPSFLAALALAFATPPAAAEPPAATTPAATTPADDAAARKKAAIALMLQRRFQAEGVPVSAVAPGAVAAPGASTPGPALTPQQALAQGDLARQAEYDKQFPPAGSFKKLVKFSNGCWPADNCDRLASFGFVQGGYDFVALKKDVEDKKLTQDSGDYRRRYDAIRGTIRANLDEFKPGSGVTPEVADEFLKVTNPVATVILTKQELVKYAERNAAISNSAPFYTNLGQVLNGAGSPGKAQAAFSAALQRDPKSEAALSGRAEARLELGDYPGAVIDASAALKMDPNDLRALTALHFSDGRLPAGASDGLARARAAGAGAGAGGPGDSFSPDGPEAATLGQAGAAASAEFARRSEGLVADAKRSLSLGDSNSAVESLRNAIKLNPRNAEALSLSAMAYIRLKDYNRALAAVQEGLKLAPNSAALLDSESFILNNMKDYQGALAAADLALSTHPGDSMAYFNRAAALGGLHDHAGMLVALKAAADLNPAQFAPVLNAALQLPEDSDILYLFPGNAAGAKPAPVADAAVRSPSRPALWAGLSAGALAVLLWGLRMRRSAAPPPPAGVRREPRLLAGKYEVGREIGSGGMGVVYEGRDRSLDRAVAVKRMREEIRWDLRERERFVAEAKLVAKLRHPHIVEIHAIVEEDGEVYLIFERVAGRTLHEVIAENKKLPFKAARGLFRGVASAVDYAQNLGVIHRDLKPANIMVNDEGQARVMDFGIARLTQEALSRHSRTSTALGTPLYMAPEQEMSAARKESDVFSMGVCLYEALTGARPFAGIGAGLLMNKLQSAYAPASKLVAGLPPGLDAVFAKALEPDPDKRFPSAGSMLRALEGLEAPRTA